MNSEIEQAIADIQEARKSHLNWAEYFEQYPEAETQYFETGEWDTAKTHRAWVEKYDRVIRLLSAFIGDMKEE
jgi:hypothetical protein